MARGGYPYESSTRFSGPQGSTSSLVVRWPEVATSATAPSARICSALMPPLFSRRESSDRASEAPYICIESPTGHHIFKELAPPDDRLASADNLQISGKDAGKYRRLYRRTAQRFRSKRTLGSSCESVITTLYRGGASHMLVPPKKGIRSLAWSDSEGAASRPILIRCRPWSTGMAAASGRSRLLRQLGQSGGREMTGQCGAKRFCREMTSCAEARYYLTQLRGPVPGPGWGWDPMRSALPPGRAMKPMPNRSDFRADKTVQISGFIRKVEPRIACRLLLRSYALGYGSSPHHSTVTPSLCL